QEHVIDDALNYPVGIHSADMTGDGYCDVFLADWYGLDLNFYRNMGGSGTEWAKYHLDSNPYRDVDAADFDGDGNLDILSAASGVDELSWHELTGHTSGWLESSIFDVTYYPKWDSITWVADEPPETALFFQLRSSNDWEEMGSWCDTIFQPGSLEGYIDSTHRYIQYRVGMTADTAYQSPILDEVRIYWTNLGIEGDGEDIEFSLEVFPNPAGGAVNVAVPALFAEGVALDIYDLAGRHLRSLESDSNVFQWDGRDQWGNTVPSGLYIVRGRFEDRTVSARVLRL
ncbi:MAG: T9SS type A sorting domain-containing protein, partial [Candidatus Aegiribacteria sp.]|nr:T9SS type A sorting domain-containing protein [Candidatus Aegiribacteria sp.]